MTYGLGIGILSSIFGLAFIAFLKRALHMCNHSDSSLFTGISIHQGSTSDDDDYDVTIIPINMLAPVDKASLPFHKRHIRNIIQP